MMNRLREKRVLQRITQIQLWRKTGISTSRLSYFENGYLFPKKSEIRKLSKALGVSPEDLFDREE